MAYQPINDEDLSRSEKGMVRMRSITNYVMGVTLIVAGFIFLFPPAVIAPRIALYEETTIKLFAGLCFIYGAFRIYRGYKKNYFRGS